MNLLGWLTGCFSNRGKSLALYQRGMTKSRKHDHQGAIKDYTSSIEMQDAPSDVKAMALYNRALVYSAAGNSSKATTDLDTVLGMPEAPPIIKAEAKRKLVRIQSRSTNAGG